MGRASATLTHGAVVSGEGRFVAQAVTIDQWMVEVQRAWVALLRARGIKAAHPDDGWVNRGANTMHLAYPQFNDGLEVGDLLALGRPDRGLRVVRVTGFSANRFAVGVEADAERWYVHFETSAPA